QIVDVEPALGQLSTVNCRLQASNRPVSGSGRTALSLREFPHGPQEIRPVYGALGIDGDPFGQARAARVWVRARVRDERPHGTIASAPDPDAALGARVE